jgi:hypothetical protein
MRYFAAASLSEDLGRTFRDPKEITVLFDQVWRSVLR